MGRCLFIPMTQSQRHPSEHTKFNPITFNVHNIHFCSDYTHFQVSVPQSESNMYGSHTKENQFMHWSDSVPQKYSEASYKRKIKPKLSVEMTPHHVVYSLLPHSNDKSVKCEQKWKMCTTHKLHYLFIKDETYDPAHPQ